MECFSSVPVHIANNHFIIEKEEKESNGFYTNDEDYKFGNENDGNHYENTKDNLDKNNNDKKI